MNKASRRFTSYKTAKKFAEFVKGELKDLRKIKGSKSNFKVIYDKNYVKSIPITDWDEQFY